MVIITNWLLRTRSWREGDGGSSHSEVRSKVVVNCAGLYGDTVEAMRCEALAAGSHDEVKDSPFHVHPRKGQFVVFEPRLEDVEAGRVPSHVIEPVPTVRTKGVIIWRTVYGNIVVGPTAEDTDDREDRSNDEDTIEMLKKVGKERMPCLERARVVGTYSGLRPATEHRDYQIEAREGEQWITVGGIRSTGLTGSSGIGEYVAGLYLGLSPALLRTIHGGDVSPPYASAPLHPPVRHANQYSVSIYSNE